MLKKGFSLLISLSVMLQGVGVYGEKAQSENSAEKSYIINDQFETDSDGWVVGAINSSVTKAPTVTAIKSYTDANGVTAEGVLEVKIETDPAEYSVGGQPNIYREFDEPYTYMEGTPLIIKTRVLHTSEGYGRFDLMHNRKNTTDTDTTGNSITDNAYSSHYTLFDVKGDKNNVSYPSSVSGNTVNTTELVKTGNIANKWIDVEMVIDGKNDSMTIKTTVDGKTEIAETSIKQPKSVYVRQFGATPESGWSEPPQMTFDALESLTFLQRTGKDTLYIDYVQVYEGEIEAEIKVNPTYTKGKPITVIFNTKAGNEAFKDAVSLFDEAGNEIEAENSIDSTNKIVTITPKEALEEGKLYFVKVDEESLSKYNFKEAEKSFRISSCIIDDTFTSGTTEGWIVGAINPGVVNEPILNVLPSYTDANGVMADGVLEMKIESAPAEYSVGGQPNIYKHLGTPYVYKDEGAKVVIKTRVLHLSEGYGRFDLMHNRKNTTDTDTTGNSITDNAYSSHYTLFDVRGDKNNVSYPSSVSGNTVNTTELVKTDNIANKWIDVEMVIDGKNDSMTIKTTVDGKTETAETSIKQPKSVYVRHFGATPESGWSEPPKWSFEGLESLTFLQRSGTDTVYIDYVQVYEQKLPVLKNVSAKGHIYPGEEITAEYTYEYDVAEGESQIEWYVSDSLNGTWTKLEGENGKTLEVDEDVEGKFVKFTVTPASENDMWGKIYESNVLTFEQAPIVSNLRTNHETLYIGMVTYALYDYSDINGDAEADSIIEWEMAESQSGEWTKIGEGSTVNFSNDLEGKFIRFSVTPASDSDYYPNGETVTSKIFGPVENILDSTNEFVNSGIETGDIAPWQIFGASENYEGIELYSDDAYKGKYSLLIHPGMDAEKDKSGQAVVLEGGNRYIIACAAKRIGENNVSDFGAYIFNLNNGVIPYEEKYEITKEWTKVISTADVKNTDEYEIGFMSFAEENGDVIVDDMYCGKLLISDIETVIDEAVVIPENGSVSIPVTTGRVFNQLGTTTGLEDEEVVIKTDKEGVSVEGNNIIVNSNAVTGKFNIELSCTPSYKTTVQKEYVKRIEVELVAPENKSPRVSNVEITGEILSGNTLYGKYDFYQVEGKDDNSEFRWIFSDAEEGDYEEIPGADQTKYIVTDEYKDKFIKFVVIPKTSDGLRGEEAVSDALIPFLAPTADEISVSGDFSVGGEIVGTYRYLDINNDPEGETIFKWYIGETENGEFTEIEGENNCKLTLSEDMTDKYIKFSVTPVSSESPEKGEEFFSDVYPGPLAPYVTDLKIKQKDKVLYAEYKYHHEHGAAEKGTKFEWLVDGKSVSALSSYIIDFTGTKKVTLTVIPGGDTNPSHGKPVSVTSNIKGNTKASGGVSGGSGGGAGGGGFINTNKNETDKNDKPAEFPLSDLGGHWGAEYVKNMVLAGVMSADENGKYNPDEYVTREEMVTYLFKALKLQKTDYTGIFEDVSDGEFGKILQTMVDNGTIARDVRFRPTDGISRQEFCKILYVSLNNAGKLTVPEENLLTVFADYNEISDWAKDYVNAIYSKKLMIGISEDFFAPCGKVTKAQAATILTRMMSLKED